MENTGQDAYPKNTGSKLHNQWRKLFKLICGHMFIKFLICSFFLPEYTILSDWNSLFTFTQTEASCLYVGKPSLLGVSPIAVIKLSWSITYHKSSSITNAIWLILDNIAVYSTTQLSAVCVISIISYKYITILEKYTSWLISNSCKCVNHIPDKRLYICVNIS